MPQGCSKHLSVFPDFLMLERRFMSNRNSLVVPAAKPMSAFSRFLFTLALFTLTLVWFGDVAPCASYADCPVAMGCGNFAPYNAADWDIRFAALKSAHMTMCRFGMSPGDYWDKAKSVPKLTADAFMLKAHAAGITPEALFEYYGRFYPNDLIGPESKWNAIGREYAARYSPNSAWLKSQGISNWGVSLYQAFNEADYSGVWGAIPKNAVNPLNDKFQGNYHDALRGLANGVHSVNPALKVVPGGFATPNAMTNYALNGFGAAIVNLWNSGTLDGIDLHIYNDHQYAPLFPKTNINMFCAYYVFRKVKQTLGITTDLDYYCTEFNYKNPDVSSGTVDDDRTAKMLLTQIWTTLGAVKNDGHTPATKLAFLWSLFPVEPIYTTVTTLTPYTPRSPAKTYQLVAELTNGLKFTSLDPFKTGTFTLGSKTKKMWVWIDQPGYSTLAGTTMTIAGIPPYAKKIELYGWDGYNGPRQTIPTNGQSTVSISGLSEGETYMAVASAK